MAEDSAVRNPSAGGQLPVTVNGKSVELAPGTSIAELVAELAFTGDEGRTPGAGIAVAVNSAIVARSEWSSTFVQPGDVVEVLTAAAGG